jgi:membrane-anchored glycerophosphoryl diester phosphodiesterase (GDPDase)
MCVVLVGFIGFNEIVTKWNNILILQLLLSIIFGYLSNTLLYKGQNC